MPIIMYLRKCYMNKDIYKNVNMKFIKEWRNMNENNIWLMELFG